VTAVAGETLVACSPDGKREAGSVSSALAPSSGASVSRREHAIAWIAGLHDELTALFAGLERAGSFREDRWNRPGGGGGVTRVLSDGETFEKAGVNRSAVEGVLPAAALLRLGGRMPADEEAHFFATGVSLVVHPRNPCVPPVASSSSK
jgi:coproporphyrinogen III oxidase